MIKESPKEKIGNVKKFERKTNMKETMSLQQYKQKVIDGNEDQESEWFWKDLCELCEGLELQIFIEKWEYTTLDWLRETMFVRRPYFEMCGPKISKQKAIEMALDYQWRESEHNDFGLMACYNDSSHIPNNYGLFKLNGNIGLNGICWKWNKNIEVLCANLDMIKSYPEFEFAVAISHWDEVLLNRREDADTWDGDLQPEDVAVGFAYDPAKKLLKILGPKSAWETVKQYQAKYTVQERRLFDPDESAQYYAEDPQGRAELAEYIEYANKNALQ